MPRRVRERQSRPRYDVGIRLLRDHALPATPVLDVTNTTPGASLRVIAVNGSALRAEPDVASSICADALRVLRPFLPRFFEFDFPLTLKETIVLEELVNFTRPTNGGKHHGGQDHQEGATKDDALGRATKKHLAMASNQDQSRQRFRGY